MSYTITSIARYHEDLKSGKITCSALLEQSLAAIKERKDWNVFLETFDETARQQAAAADKAVKEGNIGRLTGVLVSLKDNICYQGHKVSASSKILGNFSSLYNATVVDRLLAEGAVIIGRTNCDEFAMGSSNENSAFGPVHNPRNPSAVPGGSSGGAAAAVAAGFCHVSLGSDTGGSIRQPASFCGVVGMKPTYGRVSRWGLIAYASSFDQIGPLTNCVADAALVLEIIAGPDQKDATASSKEIQSYSAEVKTVAKKPKIAFLKDCMESEGLDPEVKRGIETLMETMRNAGWEVEGVSFPYLDYLVPTYYVLTTAEASSNLARFDGVHYGYRSQNAVDLESTYKKSRTEGFGTEVKRRIMLGTFVLSAGYYDAYYSKGQKVRRVLKEKTEEILQTYDFILTPSTPGTAFTFGKNSQDPIKMYLEDIFTVQANIAGVPAISVVLGQHSNGLPMGVQLMGRSFKEKELFQAAYAVENMLKK